MSNGLPSPKTSGIIKIITLFFAAFGVLMLLVALFLPTFFSTSLGTGILTHKIGQRLGLKLDIDSLSLSWFGTQSAQGIHVQKEEDQLSFHCSFITTDAPLWKWVFQKDMGRFKIQTPELQLSKPFQPLSHLCQKQFKAASFVAAPRIDLSSMKMPMRGQIVVEQGKIVFNPPELEPILFEHITSSLDFHQEDETSLTFNCTTRQQEIQGQMALQALVSNLKHSLPHLTVQSSISNLPMRGIDQLTTLIFPDLSGLLVSAVGNTIDLQCNANLSLGDFDLNVNLESPQIHAQIATKSIHGKVTLKNPATLNFYLTPALLQKLAKLYPPLQILELKQSSLFQLTLSQFSCPLPTTEKDLLKASFQATLTAPPQFPLILSGNLLLLNHLSLFARSSLLEEGITIHASSELQSQGQLGSLSLDSQLVVSDNKPMTGNLSIHASKFPVDLVGAFVPTPIALSTLLGTSADLNCALDLASDQPKLHFSWESVYLNIEKFDLSLGDPWVLITPASFSYQLTPQLMTTFFPEKEVGFTPSPLLQGTIQSFSLSPKNIRQTHLDMVISSEPFSLNGDIPFTLTSFKAVMLVNTLDHMSLHIEGAPFNASLSGSLNLDRQELTLSKPLTLKGTIDNPLLKQWSPSLPELAQPLSFLLSFDPFVLPLSDLSLATLKAKGNLSVSELVFLAQPSGKQIALQNLHLPFQWDGRNKMMNLQLNSHVKNPNSLGSIQGQFTLSHLSLDKGIDVSTANLNGSLDLQNISSLFLDAFSGKAKLSAITGTTFSCKMKLQSSIDKQNMAIQWTSPYLNVNSTLIMNHTNIQLQGSNTQIQWILSPEGYKALDSFLVGPTQAMVPFEIKDFSPLTITVSKLLIPVIAKKTVSTIVDRIPEIQWDLKALQIAVNGNHPKLTIYDKTSQETIQLSDLTFSMSKNGSMNPLNFELDCNVLTQDTGSHTPQGAKNGSLSIKGTLDPTTTPEGAFDLSQLTANLQLKVRDLPSRALDIFARAKGRTDFPFTTLFGKSVHATLSFDLKQFTGPVSLNINTALTRASLAGTMTSGALMLTDPIYAQIKVTPEISRLVLKEVNPLNLSYVYSQDPITLEIPTTGVYLPLYPFNKEKMAVPKARIELGKIHCKNEGNVNIALGLLKTKQFDQSNELQLWFAPIDLKIQKGEVDVERTEILLANTFDICIWGHLDLSQDYVDMTLGLTAQTLSKAFGIKNLPENYVLTIPLKGPADNVQINTGKATAKVALLLAWQQQEAIGGLAGGPAGAIVGGLLKKMATLPDSDVKVPPAKRPFPWENSQTKKKTSHSHEKRRKFKHNEKPLKQILKVIK